MLPPGNHTVGRVPGQAAETHFLQTTTEMVLIRAVAPPAVASAMRR